MGKKSRHLKIHIPVKRLVTGLVSVLCGVWWVATALAAGGAAVVLGAVVGPTFFPALDLGDDPDVLHTLDKLGLTEAQAVGGVAGLSALIVLKAVDSALALFVVPWLDRRLWERAQERAASGANLYRHRL